MKIGNKISNIVIRLSYATRLITLLLFGYIVVTHILKLLTLDTYVDPKIFDINYLRILISLAFFTSMTSLLIALRYGSTKFVSFLNLSLKDKISYFYISVLLGYFLAINDVPPDLLQVLSFIAITCFYILLLPSLIQSYDQFNFLQYKQFFPSSGNGTKFDVTNNLLFMTIALFIFTINNILFFSIAVNYLNGNAAKESLLRKVLYLKRVSPNTTTTAEHATLFGYNLGWKSDSRSKLMSSDGEIPSSIWTNEQIYFEIPLHVKEGVREFWVVKPKNEGDPNSTIIKSNRVFIKIESRFKYNPDVNDSFIERQIKKIKKFFL